MTTAAASDFPILPTSSRDGRRRATATLLLAVLGGTVTQALFWKTGIGLNFFLWDLAIVGAFLAVFPRGRISSRLTSCTWSQSVENPFAGLGWRRTIRGSRRPESRPRRSPRCRRHTIEYPQTQDLLVEMPRLRHVARMQDQAIRQHFHQTSTLSPPAWVPSIGCGSPPVRSTVNPDSPADP